MIDVIQALLIDVADQRGHFSAGMHFAVGEQGDEVEGRPAAVTCATAARRKPLLPAQEIKQVVFKSHAEVRFSGIHIPG